MTKDCICGVNLSPRPFKGPKAVPDRYLKQWEGFPDFDVRVRRIVSQSGSVVVTRNEWTGTHRGKTLQAEYVFYDLAGVLTQLGVLDLKKLGASVKSKAKRKR